MTHENEPARAADNGTGGSGRAFPRGPKAYNTDPVSATREAARRFNDEADGFAILGGIERFRSAGSSRGGHWTGPCPACGGGTDRLSVYPMDAQNGGKWHAVCRRAAECRGSGDKLRWAVLLSSADPDERGATAKFLRAAGYLAESNGATSPRTRPVGVVGALAESAPVVDSGATSPTPPSVPPPRTGRRDPVELRALLGACGPVSEDPECVAYLRGRGLDPVRMDDLGAVLALPPDLDGPRWARCGGVPWARSGHRLLTPLIGQTGKVESVRARSLDLDAPAASKSLAPAGASVRGLVMACPLGRELLSTGCVPEWWPADTPFAVVIAEGEPDFWSAVTEFSDADERAPVVLGITSGAWSPDLAACIPDRARVVIQSHADAAGDRYANTIARTLATRCDVRRGELCK